MLPVVLPDTSTYRSPRSAARSDRPVPTAESCADVEHGIAAGHKRTVGSFSRAVTLLAATKTSPGSVCSAAMALKTLRT